MMLRKKNLSYEFFFGKKCEWEFSIRVKSKECFKSKKVNNKFSEELQYNFIIISSCNFIFVLFFSFIILEGIKRQIYNFESKDH